MHDARVETEHPAGAELLDEFEERHFEGLRVVDGHCPNDPVAEKRKGGEVSLHLTAPPLHHFGTQGTPSALNVSPQRRFVR
jgi:hypothetical protein